MSTSTTIHRFDRSSFTSRGWTAPGQLAIRNAILAIVGVHDEVFGGSLVDSCTGRTLEECGGHDFVEVLHKAPSFLETRYGSSVAGPAKPKVFSNRVYDALIWVQRRLQCNRDKKLLGKLFPDIVRHGDAVLGGATASASSVCKS